VKRVYGVCHYIFSGRRVCVRHASYILSAECPFRVRVVKTPQNSVVTCTTESCRFDIQYTGSMMPVLLLVRRVGHGVTVTFRVWMWKPGWKEKFWDYRKVENDGKWCCKNGTTLRVFHAVGGSVPKKYVGVYRCVVNINFWLMLKQLNVNVKTRNLLCKLGDSIYCNRWKW
jgi:hypothetical protein